jgi:hypothetical protein
MSQAETDNITREFRKFSLDDLDSQSRCVTGHKFESSRPITAVPPPRLHSDCGTPSTLLYPGTSSG